MIVNAGTLSDGQIGPILTSVYTVPSSVNRVAITNAKITYLSLLNTSSTEQTVDIYIKRLNSPVTRRSRRFVLLENEHAQWISRNEEPTLSVGDAIQMVTTTDSVVDYTVCGEEVNHASV